MDCYEQHPGIILGAQFVPNEKVSSYGIEVLENRWQITCIVSGISRTKC